MTEEQVEADNEPAAGESVEDDESMLAGAVEALDAVDAFRMEGGEATPDEIREDEADEGAAAAADPGGESHDSTEEGLPEHVQASIDKRIGREVSKRKELEDQLENQRSAAADLKRQLDEAREANAAPVASFSPNRYDGMSPVEVQQEEQGLRKFCRWAEGGPLYDGGDLPAEDGETRFVDVDEVRSLYASAKESLEEFIPEAIRKSGVRARVKGDVEDRFPELGDARTEAAKNFNGILEEKNFARFLQAVPEARWLAAWAARGVRAEREQAARKARRGPRNNAAPTLPSEPRPGGSSIGAGKTRGSGLSEDMVKAAAGGDLASVVGAFMGG